MHELNIQTICANTSSAKGRVERAHLTLQDRLVKELRLRGILIEEIEISRKSIGKYIEVWHYPDGRKELRLNGVALPYSLIIDFVADVPCLNIFE